MTLESLAVGLTALALAVVLIVGGIIMICSGVTGLVRDYRRRRDRGDYCD